MGGRNWAARHARDGHRRDDCPSLAGSRLTGSRLTHHWPVGQPKAGPGAVLLHFAFRARQSPSHAVAYSPAGHLRTVDRLPYPRQIVDLR